MSGRFLLDTNIVIALWANDAMATQQLAGASEVFVPIIVLGELYYGARKSAWSAKNIARIDDFAARSSILLCDLTTAQQYGEIKIALRAKGRPIPENDLWIAALARQYSLTLATRDDHFGQIDGLTTVKQREDHPIRGPTRPCSRSPCTKPPMNSCRMANVTLPVP